MLEPCFEIRSTLERAIGRLCRLFLFHVKPLKAELLWHTTGLRETTDLLHDQIQFLHCLEGLLVLAG